MSTLYAVRGADLKIIVRAATPDAAGDAFWRETERRGKPAVNSWIVEAWDLTAEQVAECEHVVDVEEARDLAQRWAATDAQGSDGVTIEQPPCSAYSRTRPSTAPTHAIPPASKARSRAMSRTSIMPPRLHRIGPAQVCRTRGQSTVRPDYGKDDDGLAPGEYAVAHGHIAGPAPDRASAMKALAGYLWDEGHVIAGDDCEATFFTWDPGDGVVLARFEVVGESDDKALRGWTDGDKQESTHDELTICPDKWDVGTVIVVTGPMTGRKD